MMDRDTLALRTWLEDTRLSLKASIGMASDELAYGLRKALSHVEEALDDIESGKAK